MILDAHGRPINRKTADKPKPMTRFESLPVGALFRDHETLELLRKVRGERIVVSRSLIGDKLVAKERTYYAKNLSSQMYPDKYSAETEEEIDQLCSRMVYFEAPPFRKS